ncbi:MAG: TetR/AcrR family bet gene transcriptional repressor [Halieaceae bacterium]|jgi:TetR/AcrR family transcriptional repressor of bet genes
MDNKTSSTAPATRRVLPKSVRKEQLIKATMKCIAQHGLSGTTMALVTKEAGLSLGIANLHFESKEKLLVATLLHVTDEYNRGQKKILESDRTVAARMEAILQFDFSSKVATKDKMAVWFAFWGEAKSRPTYQEICSKTDFIAEDALCALFQLAIKEEYAGCNAAITASGYTALVDGLWLNMLIAPKHISRKQALHVARDYLAAAFPRHIKRTAN